MAFLIRILARFVLRVLLRRSWGWMLLGGLVLLFGLILGVASQQVTYQTGTKTTIIHYLYDDTTHDAYLQLKDSSLYFLNEQDFSPQLSSDALQSDVISLVYNPSSTQSIDASSDNTSTHLDGTGSAVVEVISYDANGQNPKTFATSDYRQHPEGYYENNWPLGSGLIIVGLLFCVAPLIFMLVRKNKAPKIATAAPFNGGIPVGQYPPASNYGQPTPATPGAYPYQQAPGAYPPPSYGQPYPAPQRANPYGQLPQTPAPGYYPAPNANQPAYPPPAGSEPTRYGSPYDAPPQA